MDITERYTLLLSTLSIYQGVLNRSVPKAFYRLLCCHSAPPADFLAAWGAFTSLLFSRGYAESLCGCITKAALYDENCFSEAAAKKKESTLSAELLRAARRDLDTLTGAGMLTPEDILSGYRFREEIRDVVTTLPRWRTGHPVRELKDKESRLENAARFYRKNGCGVFARWRAFIWRDGGVIPVNHPDPISLGDLKGYEYQRNLVLNNTLAFLKGKSANNCLLYGDKGTGKSSTVKAIVNRYSGEGLRIVEMPKESIVDFPLLVDKIASVPMKFIIYIDDLTFQKQDDRYASLKAVLEGGLAARPKNALIYATSNRRHLIQENFSDREGDDMHRNDTIQESLSLSDRFGLSVNFSVPDKKSYFEIVKEMAKQSGLKTDEQELLAAAERWALERGGRSPRCARQFIDSCFTEKDNTEVDSHA